MTSAWGYQHVAQGQGQEDGDIVPVIEFLVK